MPALRGSIGRLVLGLVAAPALLYTGDWLVLHLRRVQYQTFTSTRVLAIPQKSGRVEYQLDELHPTQTMTCARSLFPQGGAKPCWYVTRHLNDPIPM